MLSLFAGPLNILIFAHDHATHGSLSRIAATLSVLSLWLSRSRAWDLVLVLVFSMVEV